VDKPRLVVDNAKPQKARAIRRAPKVSPYCPACSSSTWFQVSVGRADYPDLKPLRQRCCVHCLANGKVTTW
jgi:hypothetical protein